MSEKIYILLPVHNRREITRRFIDFLNVQTHQNFHLVLIDDGSCDGTADMVRENIAALTVIKGTGDWWWAGSLQQGLMWLIGQGLPPSTLILIINDDTLIEANFLDMAVSIIGRRKRTLLLAQCFSHQNGRLMDAGVHVDWRRWSHVQAETVSSINCLSTRGLFLHVEDFIEIGGFYPHLLPHYLSDYEFTIRAHRVGMDLITDPRLKLWLDEETTGCHKIVSGPFLAKMRELFSNRSVFNPINNLAYVVLACPWPWIPINMARVIMESMIIVAKLLVYRFHVGRNCS